MTYTPTKTPTCAQGAATGVKEEKVEHENKRIKTEPGTTAVAAAADSSFSSSVPAAAGGQGDDGVWDLT